MKKLSLELRQIETKEDLQKAIPRLRKRFNQMADLLVQVRKFPLKESDPSKVSEELFLELARLYQIPGGREIVELAQSEAVSRLQNASVR